MDNQRFIILSVRALSGEAHEQDLRELKDYFSADESYKKKFDLLAAFWENKKSIQTDTEDALRKVLQRIRETKEEDQNASPVISIPAKRNSGIRSFSIFSKVAVLAIVCMAAAYFLFLRNPSKTIAKNETKTVQWEERSTAKGAQSVITLKDGTKVTLNSDSHLRFPAVFSENKREVFLSGEAFFDVTHNEKAPFVIHTSKMNIRVLGTEFNVRSYPNDSTSEATLIRGIIEVTLDDRPSDKIILRPKEKLIVSNEVSTRSISSVNAPAPVADTRLLISNLHYISPTDSDIVETSWMENKLVFQDESFARLAADLERKYGVSIQFEADAPKEFRFTGVFEKETIEQILRALRLTEKFGYKISGNQITIY